MPAVSYQVFARKYRPRTFADVLGQDHVVRTLQNAIAQKRLAHAYLFVGPRGTGKTSTARIFAKALNCPGGPSVDFDPDDPICVEIEKGIALDVREIDGASNNGVDQVRDLREEVKFAPACCRYKIYYIDEVHMLSTAAFNALLKTLEEPPEHVKFIFATTEAHKILPTIISRCQRFDLRRIPAGLIAKHLLHIASLEKISLDEKAAYAIAKGADGGMRDAQSMLDQLVAFCGGAIAEQDVLDIFGFTRGETVAGLALKIIERDTVGALQDLHAQADSGKDLSRLLADLIQHFRTVLVDQIDPAAAEEDLSPEVAAMTRAQAAMIPAEPLLRVMDGLAEVDARMRWAGNKLLHFEIGVIQAVQTLGEVTLSEVIEAIGGGGAPVARTGTTATPRVVAAPVVKAAPSAATAPAAAKPVAAPLAAPVATAPTAPPAPTGDFWAQFIQRVQNERPLISHWLEAAVLVSHEGKQLKIALPESETAAREGLMRAPTRKYLEEVALSLLGRGLLLEVVLDASLKLSEPEPVPAPAAAPAPEPAAPAKKKTDEMDDELIRATVEKFKATLLAS
ncbi:MAG: DNA polymerase III subunit gamma/tau [Verrucomicrobia bacterium]|nr:DNA polymerase III subunit gamma/tau [Verrucomicrobiota bacterium]